MFAIRPLETLAERMMAVPITGLDISDESVKFFCLRERKGKLFVLNSGSIAIPHGAVVGSEIKDENTVVEILRSLRLESPFVVTSLPEEKSFVRIVEMPRIKSDVLKGALYWEMEGQVPLPLEEIYFDYEIINNSSARDHLEVLTIAFPRTLVNSYVSLLEKAGLAPLALELESQAITRALIDTSHFDDPAIMVDIGASRTSFALVAERSLALTSTIVLSGHSLNQAIATALNINESEGEKIKKEIGLRADVYEGKVASVLENTLRPLVDELEKNLEFYRDHFANRVGAPKDIERIVVTGGDAALTGLDAFLARNIHKPVFIGDPFQAVGHAAWGVTPPFSSIEALQFTTAIGLALRETNFFII